MNGKVREEETSGRHYNENDRNDEINKRCTILYIPLYDDLTIGKNGHRTQHDKRLYKL